MKKRIRRSNTYLTGVKKGEKRKNGDRGRRGQRQEGTEAGGNRGRREQRQEGTETGGTEAGGNRGRREQSQGCSPLTEELWRPGSVAW